jgi:predicted anti-sigma-YlaC factor YlaD
MWFPATNNPRWLRLAWLMLALAGNVGCSVSKFAVDQAGDALSQGTSAFATDDDPELIAAAAPFSLKLMESLLAKSPEHVGLLTATASGYTQYAFGFVQSEADRLESTDFARAQEQHVRARKLYLRARDYGLRGLDVAHPGFTSHLQSDPAGAVSGCRKDDTPLLYWTAVAWTAAIAQGKDDPALVGDLPKTQALIDRALALDESYGDGAIHSFLISYSMARPDLNEPPVEVAKRHYARALELSHGRLAGPHVSYAQSVCIALEDRACFDQAIQAALAVDPDAAPDHRLENVLMQRRAAWLASQADHWFLPPLPPDDSSTPGVTP